jgi:hypothetical protein
MIREPSAWEYNWATLFLGNINRGPGPPGWDSLEFETITYVMSSAGLGPENDCAGDDQKQLQATHSSSRQRGYYILTITTSVQLKKMLVVSLKGLVTKTNWLAIK